MEKETLERFKEAAFMALSDMIEKMFDETEVNDDVITISIAAHDIKGFQYSLNQFSSEIFVNGCITTYPPKFIRYPEYFGIAVRENIRKAREEIKKLEDEYTALESPEARLSFIDEHGEIGRDVWRRLRSLEDGIQSLESTGFRTDTIRNILHGIRTGRDYYQPEPEEPAIADEPPEEQDREFVNPEALEAERTVVDQRRNLEQEMVERRRRDEELTTNVEHAQTLIRDYFNARDIEIGHIDRIMTQDLLRMAEFENCPTQVMAREIVTHNMANPQDEDAEELQDDTIPSADEIIQAAVEMDHDDVDSRNIHDNAAVRFIEEWFNGPISQVGTIDQNTYYNMQTHIETREVPGVYLFALDRVIGAHNAAITSGRIDEIEITANTVLEGTAQRIDVFDAALRLFAHVTGTTIDLTRPGRYIGSPMREELLNSAYRSNIPDAQMERVIAIFNSLRSEPELENWEEEESRKSNMFIQIFYNNAQVIEGQERDRLFERGQLIGIDGSILEFRIDDHNEEALRLQTLNEIDEISDEDLQAAADRYDQLVRQPITEDPPAIAEHPDRDPHNDDDRI